MTQEKLERAVARVAECLRPANPWVEPEALLAQLRSGDWAQVLHLARRVLADHTTPARARRAAELLLDAEPEPAAAQKILAEPRYGDRVLERAVAGTLPPAVEAAIWHVAAAAGLRCPCSGARGAGELKEIPMSKLSETRRTIEESLRTRLRLSIRGRPEAGRVRGHGGAGTLHGVVRLHAAGHRREPRPVQGGPEEGRGRRAGPAPRPTSRSGRRRSSRPSRRRSRRSWRWPAAPVRPSEPTDPLSRILQRLEDQAILSQPAIAGADPVKMMAIWHAADERTREAMRRAPARVTAQVVNGSTTYSVAPLVDPVVLAQHDAELAERASPELADQVHDLTELLGAYRAVEHALLVEIYEGGALPQPDAVAAMAGAAS